MTAPPLDHRADYEQIGRGYAKYRKPDPRIAARLHAALGDARTILNVGAGAGAYEPEDRFVIAIEPSEVMRAQRPAHLPPAIRASAEDLPLDDQSVDAAMATFTVHHWRDIARGLAELVRVTRGPIVIMTFNPDAIEQSWLSEYAPELIARERATMPTPKALAAALGPTAKIAPIPIPIDCIDGFGEAYYGRPEKFLDPGARATQSIWAAIGPEAEARFVQRLSDDLASGAWDKKHGHWRAMPAHDGALRLVIRP